MKPFFKVVAAVLCLGLLVSCAGGKDEKGNRSPITIFEPKVVLADKSLTNTEKAEKFALAGEKMFTPSGFMLAEMVFQQALELDPKNVRAQLYSAALAGPMKLKGILARIKPFAYETKRGRAEYDRKIADMKEGSLKQFLLDGKPEIKTEKQLQAFGDELFKAQDKFRTYLKEHKDLSITLHANEWLTAEINKQEQPNCQYSYQYESGYPYPHSDNNYSGSYVIYCSYQRPQDMTELRDYALNRGDIEALEQMAAGVQVASIVSLAYDATGAVSTVKKHEDEYHPTNKAIWATASKVPEFLKLRSDGAALKRIISMGVDGVTGVRWASELQQQLCPQGEEFPGNRAGFLIDRGICIASTTKDGSRLQDVLRTAEMTLAGELINLKLTYQQFPSSWNGEARKPTVPAIGEVQLERVTGTDGVIETQVRPIAILQKPIGDLKTLSPGFNDCDRVHKISDDAAGGMFPNRDANKVLEAEASCPAY